MLPLPGEFYKTQSLSVGSNKQSIMHVRLSRKFDYLWVDYEYLSLGDSDFAVTQLISVSVSISSVERVIVLWEKLLDILHIIIFVNLFLSKHMPLD